jgi:DNA gyrase subunit B
MDLAFFKSHDYSALQSLTEPIEELGNAPYAVLDDDGSEAFQTDDLLELRDYLQDRGQKGIGIQRYKGLGEMNAAELSETTMNPGSRTMLQVSAEDEPAADDLFVTLMGGVVEPRKAFIEKHALDVRNLDI